MLSLIILTALLCGTFAQNVTKTVRLNNGRECPIVGLGTGRDPQGEVVKQMIYDAIEVGYRHFDTAQYYGNEDAIGEAINHVIEHGKVRRQDVFVTTKMFYKQYPDQNRREQTVESVEAALRRLKIDYIDLMLIHFPSNDLQTDSEIWSGLEDALNRGLVKSIGVSNFDIEQLTSLLKTAKTTPAMNQVESNPKKNQRELIDFCTKKGIRVTAYSPLGKGTLIPHPTIVEIGKKHNKTSAQVMVRWQIQRGVVAIPKSSKRDRIRENFDVFDFSLTDEEMKILENLETNDPNAADKYTLSAYLIFPIFILMNQIF